MTFFVDFPTPYMSRNKHLLPIYFIFDDITINDKTYSTTIKAIRQINKLIFKNISPKI